MKWRSALPLTASVRVRRRAAPPWLEAPGKTASNFHHLRSFEEPEIRRAREMEESGAVFYVDEMAPIRAAADGEGAGWAKALLAAVGRWSPDLHPRGKDGKFIETLGFVNLSGLHGFQHGQRGKKDVQGQVVQIIPDPNEPGNPIIRVKMTDPRWDAAQFGETMDVRRDSVSSVDIKGKIPDQTTKPVPKEPKKPSNVPAKPTSKPPIVTDGTPPSMAPRDLPEHPDSPHFIPLTMPPGWNEMDDDGRNAWIRDTMEGDLTAWRGKVTIFDTTGMEAGIAFNMAQTYRQLVNWDPETARRLDYIKSVSLPATMFGVPLAIADPGTDHPGGIGPIVKPIGIRMDFSHFRTMKRWDHQKAMSEASAMKKGTKPWAVDTVMGDPTYVLIHEFGHQRQFRFLDSSMRNAHKPWSPVMREDSYDTFGEVPDSSNWPDVQTLRYALPKQGVTDYGSQKTSEAYAEAIAGRAAGISTPEMNQTLDEWEEMMDVPSNFTPLPEGTAIRKYEELTPEEQNEFWMTNGWALDLPGMAFHYPDSYEAYTNWQGASQSDVDALIEAPSPGVVPPLAEAPEPALLVKPFKGTARNQSEREFRAATRRIFQDIADEYGYTGELPDVEIDDYGDLNGTLARSIQITDNNRDLWPNGAILVNPRLVERARDKELGYGDYRIMAHEGIHAMVQGREPSYPGISQTLTEGGAEVLSIAYWAKHAPAFDDRDVVMTKNADGHYGWTKPGTPSLVEQMGYKEWTQEVIKRTASKVGWDAEAIINEVRQLLPSNGTVKHNFRNSTDPDFAPPPGVEDTPEALMTWLIDQLAGGEAPSPAPAVMTSAGDPMTSYTTPMCYTCVHFQPDLLCDAFPDGIPDDILESRADHRQPFPGDSGIMYEHDPDLPEYDFFQFGEPESSSIPP